MSSGENLHMLMVRYNYKQFSVGAGMINPFFANNYKRIYENWNKYVSSYKENYINEKLSCLFPDLCLNFRFGRKYQSDGKKIYN